MVETCSRPLLGCLFFFSPPLVGNFGMDFIRAAVDVAEAQLPVLMSKLAPCLETKVHRVDRSKSQSASKVC